MGNDTSLPLVQVSPGFSTMCISIQCGDVISALHHDSKTLSVIRQAIVDTWRNGVQNEKAVCGTGWVFKLKGNAFKPTNCGSNLQQASQMIATILQKLYSSGWEIVVSCNVARFFDKSSLFFKKSPSNLSSAHPFVCVGLRGTDKMQIINLPSELIEPIKKTIHQCWTKGVQSETYEDCVLKIKLSGNPWWSTDSQSIMAKVLLQNIIATLYRCQWVYTLNINLNRMADALYFRYDPAMSLDRESQFCTINLHGTDRLRLINTPQLIVDMIRDIILTVWSHGKIQEEKNHHGCYEFKISGNPWQSCKLESVMAHYLILKILEAMLEQGWHNIAAMDVCRPVAEKSTLVFQQREAKKCTIMCISLADADKFRLINMPANLVDLFKTILLCRWSKGIQEEEMMNVSFGEVCQIKVKGCPWNGGFTNDSYHIRSFLCNIIEVFVEQGWRVLTAGDVSAKYVHPEKGAAYLVDANSFWFIYDFKAV